MIKFVGYVLLILSMNAQALVPVEGIIMGEAQNDIQSDPLKGVFSSMYDESQTAENKKIKLYGSMYQGGESLLESCSYFEPVKYKTVWQEKQAQRAVASTLQYIGLDLTIKAIGSYAKINNVSEAEFQKLTSNLVTNYCSKNLTVFSLKTVEKALQYYYANPDQKVIPSIESSPFAPVILKTRAQKDITRSKEFDLTLKNFRSLCSWGGNVEDYRLLADYLKNPFIMAYVFQNLNGFKAEVHDKYLSVALVPSADTVQVICNDLICRKESLAVFREQFPKSAGSTGIASDLNKMFCHHFRYQDAAQNTPPQVKSWIKARELEDPIFEASQLIALLTGVPDFFSSAETYNDLAAVAKASIDDRWTVWANKMLDIFSRQLFYEESLKVKVSPRRSVADIAVKGFEIDFDVTLGELDRLVQNNDKLDLTFDLRISKNYFRMIRTRWDDLEKRVDLDGQKEFKEEIARYINLQLKEKEKLFTQKLWNEDFARFIGEELREQAIRYKGPMFQDYKDEIIKVPVRFSYGLFALSYLRFRGDIARNVTK